MVPYKQYTFAVIYKVLRLYFKVGLTVKESVSRVFQKGQMPSYQTVHGWINGIKNTSGRWIGILQEAGKFKTACPARKSFLRPIELVHFIIVLERYLECVKTDIEIDYLHGQLLKSYCGSPFSPHFFI
jgi:hypothetical protein